MRAAFLALLLAALPAAQTEVAIAAFRPETRTLSAGDTAASELVVRSAAARRVWVGYSVQDPGGEWFDVPAVPLALRAGADARTRLAWPVPRSGAADGAYRVVMAVWSARPGEPGARRLAGVDRAAAFRVRAVASSGTWRAARHRLGRGTLLPEGVEPRGAGFQLRLPAGRCDGAEVRTGTRLHHGEYTARMRTPRAPGSLSAFFLYQDVRDRNDEIDIEIFNDATRRALLTTWVAGRKAMEDSVRLPFDPAAAHHDYTIRWAPGSVEFLADGVRLRRWTRGVPRNPMRVSANVWWPTWLPCAPPASPAALDIEWIRLRPGGG